MCSCGNLKWVHLSNVINSPNQCSSNWDKTFCDDIGIKKRCLYEFKNFLFPQALFSSLKFAHCLNFLRPSIWRSLRNLLEYEFKQHRSWICIDLQGARYFSMQIFIRSGKFCRVKHIKTSFINVDLSFLDVFCDLQFEISNYAGFKCHWNLSLQADYMLWFWVRFCCNLL